MFFNLAEIVFSIFLGWSEFIDTRKAWHGRIFGSKLHIQHKIKSSDVTAQTACVYHGKSSKLVGRKAFSWEQSLSLSLWHRGVKSVAETCQLQQLPHQDDDWDVLSASAKCLTWGASLLGAWIAWLWLPSTYCVCRIITYLLTDELEQFSCSLSTWCRRMDWCLSGVSADLWSLSTTETFQHSSCLWTSPQGYPSVGCSMWIRVQCLEPHENRNVVTLDSLHTQAIWC